MILQHYSPENNILFELYNGGTTKKEVRHSEENLNKVLIDTPKITVFADFTNAKVINVSVLSALAEITEKHKSNYHQIYIFGLSPFMKILSKTYFKLTDEKLHTIISEDVKRHCKMHDYYFPTEIYLH